MWIQLIARDTLPTTPPQVDSVYDELRRVTDMCEPPGLLRFGDLREKAVEVVQGLLRTAYAPTVEQVCVCVCV